MTLLALRSVGDLVVVTNTGSLHVFAVRSRSESRWCAAGCCAVSSGSSIAYCNIVVCKDSVGFLVVVVVRVASIATVKEASTHPFNCKDIIVLIVCSDLTEPAENSTIIVGLDCNIVEGFGGSSVLLFSSLADVNTDHKLVWASQVNVAEGSNLVLV